MTLQQHLIVRPIRLSDATIMSAAFAQLGWNKPEIQFRTYLQQQTAGERDVLVAELNGQFAGYVTICWQSPYPFANDGIPEVQDFNVLPVFRRQGIGTRLMDRAEEKIATRHNIVGIGVGMYPDYGHAQRLYVLRGYVPDGLGLCYSYRALKPMEHTNNDDDLALFFTKKLRDA